VDHSVCGLSLQIERMRTAILQLQYDRACLGTQQRVREIFGSGLLAQQALDR
jgi:hypothetical protein